MKLRGRVGLGVVMAMVCAGMSESPAGAADVSEKYTWQSVMVGGGGWGALVFESPAQEGLVYFKDDCSSIYRLDPGAGVWKKLNTWGSLPAGYVVRGSTEGSSHPGGANIACAANDANRAYMSWDRNLFYSDDKGDHWKAGTITPAMKYMNEVENPQPQRGCDVLRRLQRLMVDPGNKDVAYYGSNYDGLYRTIDGGKSWVRLEKGLPTGRPLGKGENTGGFINVAFDKSGGLVDGRTKILWAACRTEGVYRSTDGGETFAKVGTQEQGVYYNSAVCDAEGNFYVACGSEKDDGRVYKVARDGAEFVDVTPLKAGFWQSVDVHPSDQAIWAQTNWFTHAYSRDGGKTWSELRNAYVSLISLCALGVVYACRKPGGAIGHCSLFIRPCRVTLASTYEIRHDPRGRHHRLRWG